MTGRLALVAPYGELAELAHQVCEELGIEASVATGDLAEGVRVAAGLVAAGAEVVVSRGGTADAIKQHLQVPVVEIAVSAFDLVRTIAQARNYGSIIGVVGFRNVIYGSKSLEQVLDVTIRELEINSPAEVPAAIATAREAGVEVIVGDAVSVRCSREAGLPALLVTSGKEALAGALREARELALIRRKERARARQFNVILDFTYEGIIATDQAGRITLVNPAAEKILGVAAGHLLGRLAGEALPGLALKQVQDTGQSRLGEMHRVGSTLVVQNAVPVVADGEMVGVVATFQDASYLQAVETKVRQELYLKGHVAQFTLADIATRSPSMQRVLAQAREFAAAEATVLITGETGAGKEMIAQGVHNASSRKGGPFVAVNCAAVPKSLLESELFGYEEGAFSGARRGGKKGYFELAHGGTLFLDEIGELPLDLQARLLRVLQQKAVMRVGGDRVIPVDVRIIAATHRNLEQCVAVGAFRQDLYYRLNVLRLNLPPLRDRLEDIPLLVGLLVDKICSRTGRLPPVIGEEVLHLFRCYPWPGNVRELENILERLVVLCGGRPVSPDEIREMLAGVAEAAPGGVVADTLTIELAGTLAEMERAIIQHTLAATAFDREETCRRLGISRTTLWRRLKDLDVS